VTLVAKRNQGFEDLGLPLLYDDTEERGLVHGLRAALASPGPEWRFMIACDMPHIGAQALGRLWYMAQSSGAPGSCFQLRDRDVPEPLPSLWRADIVVAPRWGMTARDWVRGAGLAIDVLDPLQSGMLANLNTHRPAEPGREHMKRQLSLGRRGRVVMVDTSAKTRRCAARAWRGTLRHACGALPRRVEEGEKLAGALGRYRCGKQTATLIPPVTAPRPRRDRMTSMNQIALA
jgi:hypothetical protein